MEEITDNRPREINFVKNFGEEAGAPVKISEEIGRYFESYVIQIQIIKTDRETQEDTIEETYDIDVS